MRYVIILEQRGEGCDYTIGCGINYKTIEAKDFEEAQAKAKAYVIENYTYGCEYDRSLCDLEYMTIAAAPTSLPINEWWDEERKKELKELRDVKEAEERAELARLQKKYNK